MLQIVVKSNNNRIHLYIFGVRFEAPKGRPIPPEHFPREPEDNNITKSSLSSPAFLVVFSEDSPDNGLMHGSSTRGPRAACGPRTSFVRPGKGISQNNLQCVKNIEA